MQLTYTDGDRDPFFAAGWLAFAPLCKQCAYAANNDVVSLISLLLFLSPFFPCNVVLHVVSVVLTSAHGSS